MAQMIITSVPAHGHVTPMLAVAENFVNRGDQVRFLTGSRFADRVRTTGATFLPLPEDADFDDQNLLAKFPERARLTGISAVSFDVENVFARPAKTQYDALVRALTSQPADVVISEPVFMGTAFLLAHPRSHRPAVVMCGVLPLPMDSRDAAPFGLGLPPARIFNRTRNAALTRLNRVVLQRAHRSIDDQHRLVHGTDMPDGFMNWGRRADALVQFTVPEFEYPITDAPPNRHFVGPLASSGSTGTRPDWWSELDSTRPVVHVTQGTIANIDYSQVIAPTLEALADDDVLVVVSTGGRPLDTLPPLPDNARAAIYLPYDELLPRTAVFVTNGGYGGVQYALRHGVPIVATGGKEDKPEVGARVAWSGVGRRIRSEHPSPRALRRAIHDVLSDPHYQQAARRIADRIADASGFAGLAGIVDRATQSPCPPTVKSHNPNTTAP